MRTRILRIGAAGLASLLLALGGAGAAHAGRYHVYSCRMPNGEAAPVDGWSGTKTGIYTYTLDTCGTPAGALVAALGDEPFRTANEAVATWGFSVPEGENMVEATLWRAADADGGGFPDATFGTWLAAPLDKNDPADVFSPCPGDSRCASGVGSFSEPLSFANEIQIPSTKLASHLYLTASCFGEEGVECPVGQGDANNYAAAIYLFAADFTLEQTAGPTVSAVGGELSSATDIAGTSDVVFTAGDPGSGVYEALFSVDGTVVQREVIDEDGGRCRDVGQTADGLPAFLYLQPCPASVNADVGFDSAAVANGMHHLVVTVIDAAGNAATVLDRTIDVDNPGAPGPPNGRGASPEAHLQARWRSTSRARLSTAYGHRETIVGRLTGPGASPIVGAQIQLTGAPALVGARAAVMRGATTGPEGEFTIHLPADLSSRALTVAYFARIGDPHPATSRDLQLDVRAPVSLSISPRTASVGSAIYFRGRLGAGPIPPGGKPLVLEARSGQGRWIEFDVLRTDDHGRYRASYRFKFPGPALYQFRVLCEQEADYPYAEGASPVVSVQEH